MTRLVAAAAPVLLLFTTLAARPPRVAFRPLDSSRAVSALVADTVCREGSRSWHRASGDTLWLYILMDRATQRVDTQAVLFAGDSALQLRPRPRRLGPTQARRLREMHRACAATLRRPPDAARDHR